MKRFWFTLLLVAILPLSCKFSTTPISAVKDDEVLDPLKNPDQYRDWQVAIVLYSRSCIFSESREGQILDGLERCVPVTRYLTDLLNTRPVHEEVMAITINPKGQPVAKYSMAVSWGMQFPEEDENRYVQSVLMEMVDPSRYDQVTIHRSKTVAWPEFAKNLWPAITRVAKDFPKEKFNGFGSQIGYVCGREGWNCQDMASAVWNAIQPAPAVENKIPLKQKACILTSSPNQEGNPLKVDACVKVLGFETCNEATFGGRPALIEIFTELYHAGNEPEWKQIFEVENCESNKPGAMVQKPEGIPMGRFPGMSKRPVPPTKPKG